MPMNLYTAASIAAKGVIPAPFFNGINSSRNPAKHWIPGQARNDKLYRSHVALYEMTKCQGFWEFGI
jgi:hypothetical protein